MFWINQCKILTDYHVKHFGSNVWIFATKITQKNESFMNYQIRVFTLYYFTFLMHYTRVDEQNIVVLFEDFVFMLSAIF